MYKPKKTPEEIAEGKRRQRANLIDLSKREDFKEITARGGRNSRGKKQERRLLRETVAEVLSMPAVFNGKELKNPTNGEPLENLQAALVIATLKSALNGDHKAAAKIVDWLGESNTVAGININVQLGK
jgi:hypothetical protein